MSAVPYERLQELIALQKVSSNTRGTHPVGHEYRIAGDRLAELAVSTMEEFGVSVSRLSLDMGLSKATLRFFLGKRGKGPLPASMKPYKNEQYINPGYERERIAVCKRGHDQSGESARNAGGNCIACVSARNATDYKEANSLRRNKNVKKYQDTTRDSATNHMKEWTGPELEIALRTDLTIIEAARMLGRTWMAVSGQRTIHNKDPRKQALAGIVRAEL